MAGELTQDINQLKVQIRNKQAELKQLQELLAFAEQVNKMSNVTPTMVTALQQLYQEITG
jgi:hypothetical protein